MRAAEHFGTLFLGMSLGAWCIFMANSTLRMPPQTWISISTLLTEGFLRGRFRRNSQSFTCSVVGLNIVQILVH